MRIEHHRDEEVVAVQLVDGPDDYAQEIVEGVVAHYRQTEKGEDVLVRIEITSFAAQGRDTSKLDVETFGI